MSTVFRWRTPASLAIAMGGSLFVLLLLPSEYQPIAWPVAVTGNLVLWLLFRLWGRDGVVPVFDAGMLCAIFTFLYTVLPLLNFMVGGLRFGSLSDGRLAWHAPSATELGAFHWRHVLYLATFALTYGMLRRTTWPTGLAVAKPPRGMALNILVLFVIFNGYFFILEWLTGFSFVVSYKTMHEAFRTGTVVKLPLVALQISTRLGGMLGVFQIGLLVLLMQHWRAGVWRSVLLGWLSFETIATVVRMGPRSGTILLLISAALAYHRMVRPLSLRFMIIGGGLLLGGALVYGYVRDIDSATLLAGEERIFSSTNEFQSLLGTAYDVYQRREQGLLEVPWQVYLNDVIGLFPPQQWLPFEKFAASEWYLRILGISGTGVGYMFGVIAQAIVGLDWYELALRGMMLGWVLAMVHRWYVRNAASFLATVFYLWLCVRIYNTFRDTTFSILTNIVYEVVPALALMVFLSIRPQAGMRSR